MSEDNRLLGGSLRASDADRERFATELRDHAVAGRLSTDELEDRVAKGYEARTLGELDELRRDLPATPESVALVQRDRRARLVRRTAQQGGGSLGAFAVCTVIWIANGATGFFWPLFVAISVIVLLVRNGWDLFGPAADLDAVEARLDARAHERHSDNGRHSGNGRHSKRERRSQRRSR